MRTGNVHTVIKNPAQRLTENEYQLAELDAEAELGLVGDDEYELRRAELEAWLYAMEEKKRGRKGKRA